MAELFDKTFFKFLCGFIGVLSFSFGIFAVTQFYEYQQSPAAQASVFAHYE